MTVVKDCSRLWLDTGEMMELLDANYLIHVLSEVGAPIIGWYEWHTILPSHNFNFIADSRIGHNISHSLQCLDMSPTEGLLQQTKAGVWCKFIVSNYHEREGDGVTQTNRNSPTEILYNMR